MITAAQESMLPALKSLWSSCFGDTEAYVNLFFTRRFMPERMLVWLEDDAPVAMLSLLPCEVRQDGVYRPAHYIYAVATHPQWRGKGISTKLLEHTNELLKQRGCPLTLLVPAREDLIDFYEKRGYQNAFTLKKMELDSAQLAEADTQGFVLTSASPRLYAQLRDEHFVREGYVRWDEEAIAYALRENEFHGGAACKISSRYGQAVALCTKIEKTLFIKEITLPDEGVLPAAAAIARRMDCDSAVVRLSGDSALGGSTYHFGMRNAGGGFPDGAYLNLALD